MSESETNKQIKEFIETKTVSVNPSRPNRIKVRLVFTHCEQIGEKTFRQNYNTAEAVIECHAPKEEVKGHLVGVEVLGYEDEEFA